VIADCLTGINEETAGQIAFTSGVMAAGLWPMANPAAPMRKLTQFEGLESLHFDFQSQMEQMMSAYIKGIMAS
jgi:hypothetical protein